jgi:hypothetical protein
MVEPSTRDRPAPLEDARVKGAVIREFLVWYESVYGRAYVERVCTRLEPSELTKLSPERMGLGMLPTGWYSSNIVHAVLDGVTEGATRSEITALLREGNAIVVQRMTRGLYQFLFRMVGSPSLYAKHIQRAWRLLHTTGERHMELSPGRADSSIRSWPGHHPVLCELTTETMRTVFEIMGCRNVTAQPLACVSRGDLECRAILHYEE